MLCIYGVFIIQTVAREDQAQAWRAVNRTDVARLEARGTRMQRRTVVSVTSPVRVCPTTWYVCIPHTPQKHNSCNLCQPFSQSHDSDNSDMEICFIYSFYISFQLAYNV